MFTTGYTRAASALIMLLACFALSCERGSYEGAPHGYDYRTLQIVWEHEGESRGTSELYIETSGYKDGKLMYSRVADKVDMEVPLVGRKNQTTRTRSWSFNIDNVHHTIYEEVGQVVKINLDANLFMGIRRKQIWLQIMRAAIPRKDLNKEQKKAVQDALAGPFGDKDLEAIGTKISNDELMGETVKRYEIPLMGEGQAKLWLYGDIPLKLDMEFKKGNLTIRRKVVATKFVLNKSLPEEPFTIPKDYRIIDRTKPVPAQ